VSNGGCFAVTRGRLPRRHTMYVLMPMTVIMATGVVRMTIAGHFILVLDNWWVVLGACWAVILRCD